MRAVTFAHRKQEEPSGRPAVRRKPSARRTNQRYVRATTGVRGEPYLVLLQDAAQTDSLATECRLGNRTQLIYVECMPVPTKRHGEGHTSYTCAANKRMNGDCQR